MGTDAVSPLPQMYLLGSGTFVVKDLLQDRHHRLYLTLRLVFNFVCLQGSGITRSRDGWGRSDPILRECVTLNPRPQKPVLGGGGCH